jgi:hypothetical protein
MDGVREHFFFCAYAQTESHRKREGSISQRRRWWWWWWWWWWWCWWWWYVCACGEEVAFTCLARESSHCALMRSKSCCAAACSAARSARRASRASSSAALRCASARSAVARTSETFCSISSRVSATTCVCAYVRATTARRRTYRQTAWREWLCQ